MEPDKETYRSFLLRLWQVERNGDWIWRCSLEETGTGENHRFVDLEALFGFLCAETGALLVTQEEEKR